MKQHDDEERACNECWEGKSLALQILGDACLLLLAHLSYQVEERDPRNIECLFCNSKISKEELKRLARPRTVIR